MAAEPHEQFGDRLRDARLRRGLTLAELAQRTELTKGFLSQVERQLASPSVASLVRLCDALGIGPGELLSGSAGPVVRAAERDGASLGGEGVSDFRLTPAGETRLLVLQSEIAPGGGSGDEPYRLAGDAEFVYVIDGLLDIQVGEVRYRLATGDSLTFDATTARRWSNPSVAYATRLLWVLAPALD